MENKDLLNTYFIITTYCTSAIKRRTLETISKINIFNFSLMIMKNDSFRFEVSAIVMMLKLIIFLSKAAVVQKAREGKCYICSPIFFCSCLYSHRITFKCYKNHYLLLVRSLEIVHQEEYKIF